MNYEEIIERLLDEKHITAKEAIYLLQLCNKQPQYVPYWPATLQPEITYQTDKYKPWEISDSSAGPIYKYSEDPLTSCPV